MMGGVEGAPTSPTLFTSEPIKLGAGAVGRRSVSPRLRVVSGDKGVEYFPAVPVVQQQQQPPLQKQKQARPSSYGAPPSANRVVYM